MSNVMLETTNLKSGDVKVTGPYARKMIELWLNHARETSGEEVNVWKIIEIKGVE